MQNVTATSFVFCWCIIMSIYNLIIRQIWSKRLRNFLIYNCLCFVLHGKLLDNVNEKVKYITDHKVKSSRVKSIKYLLSWNVYNTDANITEAPYTHDKWGWINQDYLPLHMLPLYSIDQWCDYTWIFKQLIKCTIIQTQIKK